MARNDPYDIPADAEIIDDDPVGNPPNLIDALLHRALDAGTQHVQAKVRQATGKLAPVTLTLTGLVNDAPAPGLIELLVSLPGTRPTKVEVPYAPTGTQVPAHHHHKILQLVGRPVRIKIEIDR